MTFLALKKGTTHDDDEETNEDFMTWSRFLFLFIQNSFYVYSVYIIVENCKSNCKEFYEFLHFFNNDSTVLRFLYSSVHHFVPVVGGSNDESDEDDGLKEDIFVIIDISDSVNSFHQECRTLSERKKTSVKWRPSDW